MKKENAQICHLFGILFNDVVVFGYSKRVLRSTSKTLQESVKIGR